MSVAWVNADVAVEIDDLLGKASVEALRAELRRRKLCDDVEQPWTEQGIVDDLRTAFYARNANRFETILAAREPASDPASWKRDPVPWKQPAEAAP